MSAVRTEASLVIQRPVAGGGTGFLRIAAQLYSGMIKKTLGGDLQRLGHLLEAES